MARNCAFNGESEKDSLPVRGFPYCICQHHKAVGWHPYCVRRHNKEITKRIGESFIEIGRKNAKIPRNLRFPQDFGQFSLSAKAKLLRNFQPLPLMSDFLYFSEKSLLSSFWEVLGVLGQVGLVGLVRDSVEGVAYRMSPISRTGLKSNKATQESQVAAEHSPLWGRWRGLFLVQIS